MNHWLGVAAFLLIVVGFGMIYLPAGLIVAGLILVKAYGNLEKSGKNDRKPQ